MPIEIIADNSYSQIKGLTTIQFKKLKKHLSYIEGANAHYYGGWPRIKYLLDKQGFFPTGLLHRVISFIDQSGTLVDNRKKPKTKSAIVLDFNGLSPYQDQLDAVEAALKHDRGTISMCTGSGKSLVIALIAARLNVRTLVVVPTLEIKKQLTETFLEFFNDMSNIAIENIDSGILKHTKDFDCLIIDEAHHAAAKTYQKLNKIAWPGIFYRFFLTATPFRNNKQELLLFEAIAGKVIYNLSYKDAVRKNYVVPVDSYYIETPKHPITGYSWNQVYSEYIASGYHKANISKLSVKLHNANKYFLILVKEIKHGKALELLTGIPFVNGKDEESREYVKKFNSGEIKGLIGTTGILGEGVDTKPCEYVIIAGLGRAKSAFMQQVGRAIRKYHGKESAKVILFRDKSHRYLLRHFNEQRKILIEEYGVIPVKLDI